MRIWAKLGIFLLVAACWRGVEASSTGAAALPGLSSLPDIAPPQVPVGDVHPWDKLLGLSFYYYEAAHSGRIPAWNRVRKGLPGGWRNDSHWLDGQGPDAPGVDLSGGFYEAGNHLKCMLQFSHAFNTLSLSMLMDEAAYRATGEWDNAMRNMKRAAEYLIKAHLVSSPDPMVNNIVVQVGDPATDSGYWGRPEQMPQMGVNGTRGWRPVQTSLNSSSNAATDILGSSAGTMALLSMLLRKPSAVQDMAMADNLLSRARNMMAAANAGPQGVWMPKFGAFQYPSSSYQDDLAWGAAALCWAELSNHPGITALPASCVDAFSKWQTAPKMYAPQQMWDWDSQLVPTALLFIAMGDQLGTANAYMVPQTVRHAHIFLDTFMAYWMNTTQPCPAPQDFQLCYTPGGLAWLAQWAPLRYAGLTSCAAFSVALHDQDPNKRRAYRCWARGQMRYAAGDNPLLQSYIVGYLPSSMHKTADRPHHRSSSCDPNYQITCNKTELYVDAPNPSILKGALIGGPDSQDQFENIRNNYKQNEVALDYNAGFACSMAALARATSSLHANRCSWDLYCAGYCDTAADL